MEETDKLIGRFFDGERAALARVISLVENRSPQGAALYRAVYGHAGTAHRVGVTGPIGVGKSTLIAKAAGELRARGKRVGIVAIDPTSPFSRGALLGDRIRMGELALDDGVFVRSMATRGRSGGLSRSACMVMDVLDAFGMDVVIVETVGVGQSDLDILDSADTTAVVLMPQAGDSIQVMKAGLMEIGDVFVLNKCDHPQSDRTAADLEHYLDTVTDRHGSAWRAPVLRTRADKGEGTALFCDELARHWEHLQTANLLDGLKRKRLYKQVRELFIQDFERRAWREKDMETKLETWVGRILAGDGDPMQAADALLNEVYGKT